MKNTYCNATSSKESSLFIPNFSGEQESSNSSEPTEKWCKKYTHISDVYGNMKWVENMMN